MSRSDNIVAIELAAEEQNTTPPPPDYDGVNEPENAGDEQRPPDYEAADTTNMSRSDNILELAAEERNTTPPPPGYDDINEPENAGDEEAVTKESQETKPAEKLDCDRCGGDHESEKCPYYSRPKDPPLGYDKDGNKLEWKRKKDRTDNAMKSIAKILYYSRWVFLFCALCFISAGCYLVFRFTVPEYRALVKNDEFNACVDANRGNVQTSDISEGEIMFVFVYSLIFVAFSGSSYTTGTARAFGNCCSGMLDKCECCIPFLAVLVVVINLLGIACTGVITHCWTYYNELNEVADCVQDIDGWNKTYKHMQTVCILDWFYVSCLIVGILMHLYYAFCIDSYHKW